MKINLKLKLFSALKIQGFLCVLAGVLTSSYTRFDEKCNSQKSFVQEKKTHFKNLLFHCKKILSRARQSTYSQLITRELKTMNFIQSILNLFGRRETKRQGKYSYESRKELKAKQEKKFNKETGKTNFKNFWDDILLKDNMEGKL
jgi:hypothetical protein